MSAQIAGIFNLDPAVCERRGECRQWGISGRRRHRFTAPSGTPDYHVEPTRPTDLAWRGDTPAGAPAAVRVYRLAALTIGAGLGVGDGQASICSVPTGVPDSFIQNITGSTVGWAALRLL
jgi:hypothetical protein